MNLRLELKLGRRTSSLVFSVSLLLITTHATSASAFKEPGITGNWADFANCPVNVIAESETAKCAHSYTTGGFVQIGHSSVPISVPGDTLDLGASAEEGSVIAGPHGIINGPAQPVPGGLLGAVGNVQLTGVSAKLEWAAPVPPDTAFGSIAVCTSNTTITFDLCKLLSGRPGTAATLSVKIHLMSAFLGSTCYIGSAASPITIPLTTGVTHPPPPALAIHGKPLEFLLTAQGAVQLFGLTLVSNSFGVPVAHGCGTSNGSLVDASINHKLGLPSLPGHNTIAINAISEENGASLILQNGWTG